jgi:hypothetical protein
LKLRGVGWHEVGRHFLGVVVIEIIHGRDAGGVAEAGETIVKMEQVDVVPAADILSIPRKAAEFCAGRVKVGSRVTRVGVEKVDAGGEFAGLIDYVVELAAGGAVDEGAKVRLDCGERLAFGQGEAESQFSTPDVGGGIMFFALLVGSDPIPTRGNLTKPQAATSGKVGIIRLKEAFPIVSLPGSLETSESSAPVATMQKQISFETRQIARRYAVGVSVRAEVGEELFQSRSFWEGRAYYYKKLFPSDPCFVLRNILWLRLAGFQK